MNVTGKRGSGRTTELIKRSYYMNKEGFNTYLVIANSSLAQAIFKYSIDIGYPIKTPMTHLDFINGKHKGKEIDKFFIDDIEHFVRLFSGCPVDFSICNDDVYTVENKENK